MNTAVPAGLWGDVRPTMTKLNLSPRSEGAAPRLSALPSCPVTLTPPWLLFHPSFIIPESL